MIQTYLLIGAAVAAMAFLTVGIRWVETRAVAAAEQHRIVAAIKTQKAVLARSDAERRKAVELHETVRAAAAERIASLDAEIDALRTAEPPPAPPDIYCRPGCKLQ